VIGERGGRIVGIPLIVKPVVVPVPLGAIDIQIQDVPIAVRIPQKMYKRHLFHYPLNNSQGCIAFDIFNTLAFTPSNFVFSSIFYTISIPPRRDGDTLRDMVTGFGSQQPPGPNEIEG